MNGSKHPVFGRNISHTISLSKITVTFLSVYKEGKKKCNRWTEKNIAYYNTNEKNTMTLLFKIISKQKWNSRFNTNHYHNKPSASLVKRVIHLKIFIFISCRFIDMYAFWGFRASVLDNTKFNPFTVCRIKAAIYIGNQTQTFRTDRRS